MSGSSDRVVFGAFLLFLATLPLEAAFVLEAGFTIRPSYLALAALTAAILVRAPRSAVSSVVASPLTLAIALYLGAAALSATMTLVSPPPSVALLPEVALRGSRYRSLLQLGLLAFSALAYFVTVTVCAEPLRLRRAIHAYLGCAVLLAGYGVYQFVGNALDWPFVDVTNAIGTGGSVYHAVRYGAWYYFRSHGTFQEPLNFGHYLLSALPVLYALALYRRSSRNPALHGAGVILMILAVLLTHSKGALVGLAVALLTLLAAVGARERRRALATVGLTLAAVYVTLFLLVPQLHATIVDRFTPEELAKEPRLESLRYTLGLFLAHPILGVGIGNYALYRAAALGAQLPGTAYGVIWQVLAETGIVGLAAFGYLLFRLFRLLASALAPAAAGPWYPCVVGYLAAFAGMLVQYLSFGDRLNLYVWAAMGLAVSVVRVVERKREVAG